MARGKHLSLEEARKQKTLERFAKENPSQETRKGRFDDLVKAMAKPKSSKEDEQT